MKLNTQKVVQRMEEIGVGRPELAKRLDISKQAIQQVIDGELGKTLKFITRLGEALEIDPRDLIN